MNFYNRIVGGLHSLRKRVTMATEIPSLVEVKLWTSERRYLVHLRVAKEISGHLKVSQSLPRFKCTQCNDTCTMQRRDELYPWFDVGNFTQLQVVVKISIQPHVSNSISILFLSIRTSYCSESFAVVTSSEIWFIRNFIHLLFY